jgi:hypothetical protein
MFFIEDNNFLNNEEKFKIKNEIINNDYFPFYWNDNQTKNDNLPFLSHILLDRRNSKIQSGLYYFFEKILIKFCEKHKINLNKIFRGAINLTYPLNVKKGKLHVDHEFSHKQLIIYLNESNGGDTLLYNNNKKLIKRIEPKEFKIICFENCLHTLTYPKSGRRVICIMTFND